MMTTLHALRVHYSSFYIFYVVVMTMVLTRSVRALFFVLHFLRSCHDNGPCTLCACAISSFYISYVVVMTMVLARSARALFFVLHFLSSCHDNGPCTLCACVILRFRFFT